MEESKVFVLRCPNGPAKGKYFVSGDYLGVKWTDDVGGALRVSASDAYGHIAAAIDTKCLVLVPESLGDATNEDCHAFAVKATGDMFRNGGNDVVSIIEKAVRRSADEPLFDHPTFHAKHEDGYMSVWEWVLRAAYRGGDL